MIGCGFCDNWPCTCDVGASGARQVSKVGSGCPCCGGRGHCQACLNCHPPELMKLAADTSVSVAQMNPWSDRPERDAVEILRGVSARVTVRAHNAAIDACQAHLHGLADRTKSLWHDHAEALHRAADALEELRK